MHRVANSIHSTVTVMGDDMPPLPPKCIQASRQHFVHVYVCACVAVAILLTAFTIPTGH